jgi:ribosomal protein S30
MIQSHRPKELTDQPIRRERALRSTASVRRSVTPQVASSRRAHVAPWIRNLRNRNKRVASAQIKTGQPHRSTIEAADSTRKQNGSAWESTRFAEIWKWRGGKVACAELRIRRKRGFSSLAFAVHEKQLEEAMYLWPCCGNRTAGMRQFSVDGSDGEHV